MKASICILAYKRPDELKATIKTLHKYIDYPSEIIVNLDSADGSSESIECRILLQEYLRDRLISKLILNNGKNRGVGKSFQNCLGVAEGDFIFKVDADIIFKQNFIRRAVQGLTDYPDVGSIGLFDYHRQDPNDERFKPENNVLENRGNGLFIVKDFVSSIYVFRKKDLNMNQEIFDDGLHQSFGKMALLDVVDNRSFGFGSVYVTLKPDGTATKTQTYTEPFLFSK